MKRLLIDVLSSSRLLFGLLFVYVVIFNFNIISLIIIFALCVLSDVLDGYLARRYGLSSGRGAKIDVILIFYL